MEYLIRERHEHLLHEAEQRRRYRLVQDKIMPLHRATRRVGLWRVHGRLIAFRLRWMARRQRLSRRRYSADWQREIQDIFERREGE